MLTPYIIIHPYYYHGLELETEGQMREKCALMHELHKSFFQMPLHQMIGHDKASNLDYKSIFKGVRLHTQ